MTDPDPPVDHPPVARPSVARPSVAHPPVAEVMAIGDEMTGGARVDTNSAWIATRLQELGLEVRFHTMVGDDLNDLIAAFRIAASRASVVVCSGGLGPTRDDLTREGLAAAAGVELSFDADSMRHIESLFARRGRAMPQRNRTQAMIPAGASVIFNPHGTAPGIDVTIKPSAGLGCRFFALPGVPAEMKPMFDQSVATALVGNNASVIRSRVLKFFGIGESDMEQRLGDVIARGRQPRIGITASGATLSLRVTATEADEVTCEAKLNEAEEHLLSLVGEFYFGRGDQYELHHAVADRWREAGRTFAVVEFGVACPILTWMAGLPTSHTYRGGEHRPALGVDGDASSVDWSSIQNRFGVDQVVGVMNYTAPTAPDHSTLPSMTVVGHLFDNEGLSTETFNVVGHPSILHARAAKSVLRWLLKLPE